MIKLILSRVKISNVRFQKFIEDIANPDKTYIRVLGTSRSGPCEYCAQWAFMEHDKSGEVVPLPVVGTHARCVCNDVPKPVFEIGTKETLEETFGFPQDTRFKIRDAKKGRVARFDWLKYQTRKTQKKILGSARAGYLKTVPIEELYDDVTKHVKPLE
jgi:hypothetical protein